MTAHRYVLEVGLSKDQVVRFLWSEVLHGPPGIDNLHRMVDAWNLSRNRETFGRRPWWWARIVERETGTEVIYYKPAIDGLGRRVEKWARNDC